MSQMEYVFAAVALACMIMSAVTIVLTYEWKLRVERKCNIIDQDNVQTVRCVNDLDTALFHVKEDLLDLKKEFYASGIETLKVRSEDHDRAIESVRKDMLDIQVISGTLPSRAGTMREEVENTLEALEAVRSNYLETRALLEKTKEQVEGLAKAYGNIHFTSKTIEDIRDDIDDIKRRIEE